MSSNPQADTTSNASLKPTRTAGQAPDPSRPKTFTDVMRDLPDFFFSVLTLQTDKAAPLAALKAWFEAAGVRPPTMVELDAERQRRVDSGTSNNPPAPGAKGAAEARKRFGTK